MQHIHTASGKATQTELYTYDYDHEGRLLITKHKLNTGTEILLVNNSYDELGRLQSNSRIGSNPNLKTDYTYNVRSWMKTTSNPLFNETLYYQDRPTNIKGYTLNYNGNISVMNWQSDDKKNRTYAFNYDNLSRLTASTYSQIDNLGANFSDSCRYDMHGNVTNIIRYGRTGTTSFGLIDNLTMNYKGNQLIKAEDTAPTPQFNNLTDFSNNVNQALEYEYDNNGNMTKDLNKGISNISYNSLNLPISLVIANSLGSATNNYTYSADGKKLKVEMKFGNQTKTTDYVGSMIYENGALKRILVDGGYVENGQYHFYIQDHLGNNRVVAKADGTVIQTNHYYPFGMTFMEDGTHDTKAQPYKYNGKEFDGERGLNLYDYLARSMDPAEGRFTSIDPLAEKFYSVSPYVYCGNNPVRYIDPDGRDWYEYTDKDGNSRTMWRKSQDKTYKDGSGNVWNNVGENYLSINGDNATLFTQHKNYKGELYLSSSSYNLANEKSASTLTSALGDIISMGSALAGGFGSYAKGSNATFRLTNSKWELDFKFYGNGWKGNQWVTPSSISNLGKVVSWAGSAAGVLSIVMSTSVFLKSNTLEGRFENGLDVVMGGIGFIPVVGTGISLYWSFGGKKLHYMYLNKVLIPQIEMGINPGLPAYQPFK